MFRPAIILGLIWCSVVCWTVCASEEFKPPEHWANLPPGTSLGLITITTQSDRQQDFRLAVMGDDLAPGRGASTRMPVIYYTADQGGEAAALLIPGLLAEAAQRLDEHAIQRAVEESEEHPRLDRLSHTLTRLGNESTAVVAYLALYVNGSGRSRLAAKDMASSGLTTALAVTLLKSTLRRPRPDDAMRGTPSDSYSFPSGHAAGAFSTATIIAHHYPDLKEPAYVGAALIAMSRVALRRHYPTDVIAGAVVGTLVAKQVLKHNGNLFEWRW